MREIEDGNVSIEFQKTNQEFIATLKAIQYRLDAISHYELYLEESCVLLAGKITTASDERLEVVYELPAHAQSVAEAIKESEILERVEIARKFSLLKQDGADVAQYFIHPENLFLVSNQLHVAHRGLIGAIDPSVTSYEQFLDQYKALVISTLNPRYKFEELVTGKTKVKDKALAKILSATATSEVESIIDEQYHALKMERKLTERSVKKSRYSVFKFLTIGFATLLVGMGIWLGLLLENTVPRQSRIIDAQAAYMVNDFNESTSILSDDDPRTLPPAVQYMLAASYVELSTLTSDQRQAVINNLSPSTSEIELRYWIYIGRGGLLEALDIAYSLGDTHLKINAYAHRYDYVYADMEMPGAEKQNYLNRYLERLDELNALLDGEDLELTSDADYEEDYDNEDEDEGDEENGED